MTWTLLGQAVLTLTTYVWLGAAIILSRRIHQAGHAALVLLSISSAMIAAYSTVKLLVLTGLPAELLEKFGFLGILGPILVGPGLISWASWAVRTIDRMDHLAHTDNLTGLVNRLGLQRSFARAVESTASERPFAVMVMDLDRFKAVNDAKGHGYGDLVLQRIAQALSEELRDSDIIARQGGDEFVAVIQWVDRAAAGQVARRLKRRVSELKVSGAINLSVGVAMYPDDGRDLESLMAVADARMYLDKRGCGTPVDDVSPYAQTGR